jgi:general secretion pathway protein B
MSFILDALKKSETERQRQNGPALFEVRVAPPAARFPGWAIALGALLGINMVVFVVWLTMRGGTTAPAAASAPAVAVAAPAPAAVAAAPTPVVAAAPALAAQAPPPALPPVSAPATSAFDPPLLEDPAQSAVEPAVPAGYAPGDFQPALPPGVAAATGVAPAAVPAATRQPAARAGLPSRDDLVAAGATDIPAVALSLHVYDASPTRRFVLVNGQRAVEGETLSDGLRLEEITAQGAVLSWRGSRFLVTM